jgi:hypothetical protein
MVFLKPVGTKGSKTKFTDRELRAQAEQFGMTNLHTQRDGESAMAAMRRTNPIANPAKWSEGIPHNSPGWSLRKEQPKTFDVGVLGSNYGKPQDTNKQNFDPDNGAWKEIMRQPQPIFVGKPKE